MMPLIELKNVSKSYREPGGQVVVHVLRGISMKVEAGESLAVVGPSGCGKSTLLNILGTLVEGESVKSCPEARLAALRSEKIGFIFQMHHLMPQCTVLENVLLPTLALAQRDGIEELRQRATALLEQVGLKERLHWLPAQLSGGERQRVAVVRALINQPRLILADEPTGALDEKNAEALTALLLDLQRSTGVSLVMVTHHRAQAERMDRLLRIHEGCLVGD